jgi:hypothetical protein
MDVAYQSLLMRGCCMAFRDDDDGEVQSGSDVLQKADVTAEQHP